jgi:CRISPR system Cascade subunit CasE
MQFSLIQPQALHERQAALDRARDGAYADHQWLWERFFPAPHGTPRDFLFRRLDGGTGARFYVVSARTPRLDVPAWSVQTKAYRPDVSDGIRLSFELRANPTIARRGESKVDANGSVLLHLAGKRAGLPKHKVTRHDVVMDAKKRLLAERSLQRWSDWKGSDKPSLYELTRTSCTQWLVDAGREGGFGVDEGTLRVDAYAQHQGKHAKLRFSSVDFAGTLTVVDASKFSVALTRGIGHAKAFGCGLLLVRRVD